MNIVIIQEAGRHLKNKDFREALNLNRALSKIDGIESKVWGLNYPTYLIPFSEMEKWADVIFIIENYTSNWLPIEQIAKSNKMKIFWSIDSHCVLQQHQHLCKLLNINILLNSTESYIPQYNGLVEKSYWFPNSYTDDLIKPLNIDKNINIGFCGNLLNRGDILGYLERYNIHKDIFVIGDDMVNAINSYKIHFNRNLSNDINYRTFETTGCGTLLFTNYTPNLEKLFKIGEEIVVYENLNDLDEKINYYLNNPNEREKIEKAGYNRSKSEHTYYNRAIRLVEIINENAK